LLILTLLLWDRIAHSDASLVRANHGHIVANLVLYSLAVSLVSILFLWAHLLSLLLTLGLILHLHCGGLGLLLLLVIDIVAHLIVHQLFTLCTDSPDHLHTVLLGMDGLGLHLDLLAVPLYGGGAHLCIELHLLYMALLVSEDWGVPCMVQGGGVGDHRDGGRGGMLDYRLSLGGEGGDQEREEDSPHVVTSRHSV